MKRLICVLLLSVAVNSSCGVHATSPAASTAETASNVWVQKTQQELWQECANAVAELSDIVGAVYDPKTHRPILIGRKATEGDKLPPLSLYDLIAVMRVVQVGLNPGVSIEPAGGIRPGAYYASIPSRFSVRYIPSTIKDTHLGFLLFEADRTLKPLCLGKDNLNDEIFKTSVPGYESIPKRMKGQVVGAGFFAAPIFVPKEVVLRQADHTIWFDRIVMGVESQSSQVAAEEFVSHLEKNFKSFAKELPSLQELIRVAKMVAVARWLHTDADPPGFGWVGLEQLVMAKFQTPVDTPTITVEVSRRNIGYAVEIAMLCGGVNLKTPNTYLKATNLAGQAAYVGDIKLVDLAKTVLAARPSATTTSWDITVGGESYKAVAIPIGGS